MLQSHYRNDGEHKGLAVINSELSNLVHNFYQSDLEILGKDYPPKSWQYLNNYISPFVGYWHRLENQEISPVKTIEHLSKARDYLFS